MRFEPYVLAGLKSFSSYLDSLSSPVDSFLEDHIRESQYQRILVQDQEVGAFGVHQNTLLTHFHVVGPARRLGQQIFAEVLQQTSVNAAFVPTCDEFFLSHALDEYSDLKKQAYFFIEGSVVIAPATIDLSYRIAGPDDLEAIQTLCGDFLTDYAQHIQNRHLHIGFLADQLIALGVIEHSHLWKAQASIGMFTHEAHRQKGIGAHTIRYMRRVCHAGGLRPIAGCWYYNHNSKRTLEAAGMITQTRLLRIEFEAQTLS